MLACGLVGAGAAWAADERPPTEEVATRRLLDALDERQMPDVSIWVLDRVAREADAFPTLRKESAFRRATALVATSRLETDVKKRSQILDAAEQEIERFLKDSPEGEMAIAAFTQKGNLLVERGRAKIDQSKRSGEDQQARLREANVFFDAAIKALEGSAAKEITTVTNAEDAVLKELRSVDQRLVELRGKGKPDDEEGGKAAKKPARKPSDMRLVEQLEERQDVLRGQLLQTRLITATAYYEKSRALAHGSKEWKAALEKSSADFKELYDKYRSRGAGLFARYFEGRNYLLLAQAEKNADAKKKMMEQALLTLSDVRGLDGESGIIPGLRAKAVGSTLEGWLDMQRYADKDFKEFDDRLQRIVLATVPPDRLDADWLAMKYRAAVMFERTAAALGDKAKGRPLLQNAKKLALEVAKANRDYAKESRALLEQLGKTLPDDAGGVAASFESAMDSVRVSLASMQEKQASLKQAQAAQKADEAAAAAQAVAGERDKVIAGLRRALALATADDVDAVNQARYMLTFMLYDAKRLYDAATLGAFLAERYPNAKGSRQAAKVAMASFQQLSKDGVAEWRQDAKRQCVDVANLIMRTWPDDAESADAAVLAIAAATEARDPERLLGILALVPASSPRRADVLLRAGGALYRDVSDKRALEEAARPAQGQLDSWKRRAAEAIDEGLAAAVPGSPASRTSVSAALARVQMAIEDGDRELALRLLAHPDYGPWTLVNGNDPSWATGPLAESTLTVALRCFIQSDRLEDAQRAMDKLEQVAGAGEEASAKLTSLYLTMGRDLQSQLVALGAGGNAGSVDATAQASAILGGFEKFLDGVAKRDAKVSSQMWVATTYLSLGSGAGAGSVVPKAKAAAYLAKAAETYRRLLEKGGEEIARYEPSIRLKVANVYRELGEWDEAQKQIDWILSDPKRQNSLETQIQAAELLQAAGEKVADKAKASQYLKEAIVGRRNGSSVAWGWGGIGNKLARQAFAGSDDKALDARNKFFTARLNVAKCRLKRAEVTAEEREKLLEMAFNDIAITYKLYPEMGGKGMEKQFDRLLKDIEKSRGNPAPKGLAGLKEPQPVATAAGGSGT
ncbi:MAG: hypothetical protein EBR28_01255 [Planctomycetia bacterium]|nr:hypothetical protein [Planctomycetia bacterium]